MGFYERYLAGEHERVWHEMMGVSPITEEMVCVVQETMQRVKRNIDRLIPRIEAIGYQFGYQWLENEQAITEWSAANPLRTATQANLSELLAL